MKYCFDTNVIIDILRGDTALKSKLEGLTTQEICITPIILAELFKGAYVAERHKEALALVEDFCQNVELLDFNEAACKLFGQKYAELTKQGKQTQEADLMIASICMSNDVILVTKNQKDFVNIRGLKIAQW